VRASKQPLNGGGLPSTRNKKESQTTHIPQKTETASVQCVRRPSVQLSAMDPSWSVQGGAARTLTAVMDGRWKRLSHGRQTASCAWHYCDDNVTRWTRLSHPLHRRATTNTSDFRPPAAWQSPSPYSPANFISYDEPVKSARAGCPRVFGWCSGE